MIAALVVFIALALVQLVLALHVRNTLLSSAYEGARHGAQADREPGDGAERAVALATASIPGVRAEATADVQDTGAGEAVRVTLTAPLPVVGLWGPGDLTVSARALEEDR